MSRIRPILFNTEMVQAILDGRKTVTRRLIKPQPYKFAPLNREKPIETWDGTGIYAALITGGKFIEIKTPYQKGDILYIRETWAFAQCITCNGEYRRRGYPMNCYDYQAVEYDDGDSISDGCFIYCADHPHPERITWRPSIHMPKAAARIWLRVTDVRAERLLEATNPIKYPAGKDNTILREGFKRTYDFINCWNSTIKKTDLDKYGWDANPWVWVIEFERCEKPEVKNV